jgi:hypothetical protein
MSENLTKEAFIEGVMETLKRKYVEGMGSSFISNTAMICHVLTELTDYPIKQLISTQVEAKAHLGDVYDGFTKIAVGDMDRLEALIINFRVDMRLQMNSLLV